MKFTRRRKKVPVVRWPYPVFLPASGVHTSSPRSATPWNWGVPGSDTGPCRTERPQPPCIISAVRHASRRTRGLLVLLFLCALICAQSASFASKHSHWGASHHCCRLCHPGPLPLLQAVNSTGLSPIRAVAWLSLSHDFEAPHEGLLTAGASRAPPLSLPV